jgi:hypothetical protein
MVGPARGDSQNNSSKYPTIGGSEAYDAQTPSSNIVQNVNQDFNSIRLQAIMKSIQRMVPSDSPLVTLAQQGTEAVGNITAATPTIEKHRGKPSNGNRS